MSLPLPEILLSVLGVALGWLVIARAWTYGAASLLWVSISWGAALLAGGAAYRHGSDLLESFTGLHLKFLPAAGSSLILAVLVFVLVRLMARALFDWASDPERSFSGWFYGFRGGMFGFVPAFILLFGLVLFLRAAGTVQELGQIHAVSLGLSSGSTSYALEAPGTVKWRNATERIPRSARLYDALDPISTVPRRNLAALLLGASTHNGMNQMHTRPQLSPILSDRRFMAVYQDSRVQPLTNRTTGGWNYLKLLRRPELKTALEDPAFRLKMEGVNVGEEIRAAFQGPQS